MTGHDISAKLERLPGVKAAKGGIAQPEAPASLLLGDDVVIGPVHFLDFDKDQLLKAVKDSRVPRY